MNFGSAFFKTTVLKKNGKVAERRARRPAKSYNKIQLSGIKVVHMIDTRIFIVLFFLLNLSIAHAQLDSIQNLETVYLTDTKLVTFSQGFKVEKIQDSVIQRNSVSLTDMLQFNSSIYFKENGFGMVSSPSFRGTNASQTAVVWNGININSTFTGQTDFNIVSPLGYDHISIRSGGGGVQYGSGAIGGSVHLNNEFDFTQPAETRIGTEFGSFGTISGFASTTQVWKNHFLNIGIDFISSENDYDYIGKNKKNEHGEFTRFSAKINEARKLKRGMASWNSEYSYSDRNFSGSLTTLGKDGYKDLNTRNLIQLQQKFGTLKTAAKVAHLYEQYRYYPNSKKPVYQQGNAHTFIGQLEAEQQVMRNMLIHAKLDYTVVHGRSVNVREHTRKTMAAVFLFKHKISSAFGYGINFRQEFLNDFDNPLLFSADAKWKVADFYALRLNGSKNFRIPTFNDLYWDAGGNEDLKPETSYQIEIGQEFSTGNFSFDLATYYIDSKEMIKWVPFSGTIWKPENIAQARNYGVELKANYSWQFQSHHFQIDALYSYTKAEDLEKKKQLIYVPYHHASGLISYNFKQLSAYFQMLYNGEAFNTSDNSSAVDAYTVFNLGTEYKFPGKQEITIGTRIKNLMNTYYENVAYRPMPSRSMHAFVNLKI